MVEENEVAEEQALELKVEGCGGSQALIGMAGTGGGQGGVVRRGGAAGGAKAPRHHGAVSKKVSALKRHLGL